MDHVACIGYVYFEIGLQATVLTLNFRVTSLEENSGGSTNITELEGRVSDLEAPTGEQESRITANQENIEGKDIEQIKKGSELCLFSVPPTGAISVDQNHSIPKQSRL